MSFNLPPGVHERDIPGNSRQDEWSEKQMGLIGDELDKLPGWLSNAINGQVGDDFDTIAKRCSWLYELFVEDLHTEQLSNALPAIEEARNLAQEAEDGPPEQEDE